MVIGGCTLRFPWFLGREQQPTAKERIAACGQPPVSTALIRSLSRAPLPWKISSFHHRWRSERCWFVQKLGVSNSRIYNYYLSCTVIIYFLIVTIEDRYKTHIIFINMIILFFHSFHLTPLDFNVIYIPQGKSWRGNRFSRRLPANWGWSSNPSQGILIMGIYILKWPSPLV